MPYAPTDWVDGVTPVNAANLDKIEAGVAAAEEKALKAQANGYPSLGADGKVPIAQLPSGLGAVYYEQAATPTEPVTSGALWVDTDELPYAWASGIPLVSVLPATPANGQEVYYLADATNGIIWHLRYRVDSPSAYKWEYVGGPPIYARVDAQESTTLATYTVLATAGPSLALPLAGDYLVTTGAECHCAASGNAAFMSYDIGGTAALDADCVSSYGTGGAVAVNAMGEKRKNGLTAVTLTMKYRVNLAGTTTYWSKRFFSVIPVRVG